MDKEFINRIEECRIKLENTRIKLKEKFIGIDDVIDRIIESITLWYLAPEFQFRPQIVCLWGTTGVGKTDLVRTLVKLLDFKDKFVEIQMDEKDIYNKTIQRKLDITNLDPKDPQILLLDEFQRFNTIDKKDELTENEYFSDVWMLLSDGQFGSDSKNKGELYEMIIEDRYWQDQQDEDEKEGAKKNKKIPSKSSKVKKYKTGVWNANRLKKILKCKYSIEEIMLMDIDDKLEMIKTYYESNEMCEGQSYEKMLIFISGNLDEAFTMSNDIDNADLDADIYHEFSKKITIVNIKNSLRGKFKPEQIARFGNTHIIYPCLSKASYYKIIKMRCDNLLDKIGNDFNLKIVLDTNVYDVIYNNGVFPTQGVRPVLSTVSQILDNNVPYFIFAAYNENVDNIKIVYKNYNLVSTINGKEYSKALNLDLDKIKKNKSDDNRKLTMVHEIGHSIVHSLIYKTVPKQININGTTWSDGFTFDHDKIMSAEYIKNEICVFLAGKVAEEIVFENKNRTSGCALDLNSATLLAAAYVRSYGMNGTISKIMKDGNERTPEPNYNIEPTNDSIESILIEEEKRCKDIINSNLNLYKDILNYCFNLKEIDLNEYQKIFAKHEIKIRFCETGEEISYGYSEKLKQFLK